MEAVTVNREMRVVKARMVQVIFRKVESVNILSSCVIMATLVQYRQRLYMSISTQIAFIRGV